jgi:hypothetical protein
MSFITPALVSSRFLESAEHASVPDSPPSKAGSVASSNNELKPEVLYLPCQLIHFHSIRYSWPSQPRSASYPYHTEPFLSMVNSLAEHSVAAPLACPHFPLFLATLPTSFPSFSLPSTTPAFTDGLFTVEVMRGSRPLYRTRSSATALGATILCLPHAVPAIS